MKYLFAFILFHFLMTLKLWCIDLKETTYPAKIDESHQKAMVYQAKSNEPRPLLVALHTWSSDYKQKSALTYAKWCKENDWHMIHPHFRGPNKTPKALGSDYVVSDIEDARSYMIETYNIDQSRIYLIGVSGGGHASLLMASRHPELWTAVSAWCGITDLHQWWKEKSKDGPQKYAKHIESACEISKGDLHFIEECKKRSPLTYLSDSTRVPIDIYHGIQDGRIGSVPFSHSLRAFAALNPKQNLTDDKISNYYKTQRFENHKINKSDPAFGKRQPLFQLTGKSSRLTIFEGGHEIIHSVALNWLNQQKLGYDIKWKVEKPVSFSIREDELKSGL